MSVPVSMWRSELGRTALTDSTRLDELLGPSMCSHAAGWPSARMIEHLTDLSSHSASLPDFLRDGTDLMEAMATQLIVFYFTFSQ